MNGLRSFSPALLLAAAFILIGAQVTRVAAPERGSYLWVLVLATGGAIAGEVAAVSLRIGGPALGSLHPIAEALGIVVFEIVGSLLVRPRHRSP
jgi:hypothetical protein